MTFQTRAVLGGAYMRASTRLTHTVEVDIDGREVRVLCNRVDLNSLADEFAGNVKAKPTCPHCAAKDHRFAK
jgi:hypothetical protein